MSRELSCDGCGYDLRAHPHDGKCPECGASVAESVQLAAIPRRPAWRDSDPRWRRRMVAGTWVLVLLPLMEALRAWGWAARIPVPNIFGYRGADFALDESFIYWWGHDVLFCIGMVLLFSKERGRRGGRFDWTRKWGILGSYLVLLLIAAGVLFIAALVTVGITVVFTSMPLKYQPRMTGFLGSVSTFYLRYGFYPHDNSVFVLVVFSSIMVVLACVPLYNALVSNGPRWVAKALLAPLALFSAINLIRAGWLFLNYSNAGLIDMYGYATYFQPTVLVNEIANLPAGVNVLGPDFRIFLMEATKFSIVLVIAVWLSIAQIAAWLPRRRSRA